MALAVQRKRRLQRRGRIVQTFAQRIQVVENEVHQALAVLDKATEKMLNYRQLMRHPTYKKEWQLSSANEFQTSGERRRRTNQGYQYNQVHSHARCEERPHERYHVWTNFYISFDLKRLSRITHALSLAAIELTTQAR
jgi:hypothetical protein